MAQETEGQIIDAIGGAGIEAKSAELMRTAVTVIPPAEAIMARKTWEGIKVQIEKAATKARTITVKNVQDRATAEMWARLLKPVVRKLDDKRKQLTREIKARLIDPINETMNPTIEAGFGAVTFLDDAIRAYDAGERRKQMEAQAAEDAEAARRLKLQQAAVDRGGTARKEIVAAVVPKPDVIVSDSSTYFRLKYTVVDERLVPKEINWSDREWAICKPDAGCIRAVVSEMEKGYEKGQKGFVKVPQIIPGVEIKWEQYFKRM